MGCPCHETVVLTLVAPPLSGYLCHVLLVVVDPSSLPPSRIVSSSHVPGSRCRRRGQRCHCFGSKVAVHCAGEQGRKARGYVQPATMIRSKHCFIEIGFPGYKYDRVYDGLERLREPLPPRYPFPPQSSMTNEYRYSALISPSPQILCRLAVYNRSMSWSCTRRLLWREWLAA